MFYIITKQKKHQNWCDLYPDFCVLLCNQHSDSVNINPPYITPFKKTLRNRSDLYPEFCVLLCNQHSNSVNLNVL